MMSRELKISVLIVYLALLSGCAQSLVLETKVDVPKPLTKLLPLNIAVLYEEQFKQHVYTENSEDRPNWSITTGPSQVELFERILPSIFRNSDSIESLNQAQNRHYDAVITPQISDIQFALPLETNFDIYEVWIKYDFHIQEPSGETITNLALTGYGKSPAKFIHNNQQGLLAAANAAFRDIGAKFIVRFPVYPDIQTWLTSKSISY